MTPTLRDGDIVMTLPLPAKAGRVVLARQGSREVIKRVDRMDDQSIRLVGDNRHESTDSRHYGNVSKSDILGSIVIVLPKAINPPKLVKPYGLWVGRIAAALLIVASLVHLYRIDTFIPILDNNFPGGNTVASLIALLIIITEIFAIPFLLRVKLSPLGHFVSGALVILAPFWWVMVSIWTLGVSEDTGQFGQFMPVTSTVAVLGLNLIWLGFNHFALYVLGFNRLDTAKLLRK